MTNEKELQKTFRIFNDRYFNNRIPSHTKVRYGKPKKNADAHYDPNTNEIIINKDLAEHNTIVFICLLHEMVHAKLDTTYIGSAVDENPHHGMIFQAEIYRLVNAGAYDGLL